MIRVFDTDTDENGFTLVEVLVALGIVAVVSVTIVSSVSGMMANVDYLSEKTQCDLLARALADDIRLKGLPKEKEGSFDSHPDFRWKLEAVADDQDRVSAMLQLEEFRITVISPGDRSAEMTLLYRSTTP